MFIKEKKLHRLILYFTSLLMVLAPLLIASDRAIGQDGGEGSLDEPFAGRPLIDIDIVFSIDSSGSMRASPSEVSEEERSNFNRDSDNLRIKGAHQFMEQLTSNYHWVGLVSWDHEIDFSKALTNNYNEVHEKLDEIDSEGGTNLELGLEEALKLFEISPRKEAKRVVLLLTDGEGKVEERIISKAKALHAVVYTIGLTASPAAKQTLKRIADKTGGIYFSAPTAENLQHTFEAILKKEIDSGATLEKRLDKSSQPRFFTISSEPDQLFTKGEQPAKVTVQLNDASGQQVQAMEPITIALSTSKGELETKIITIPGGKGSASTHLIADDSPGIGTVTALVNGVLVKTTVVFVAPVNAEPSTTTDASLDLIIDQPGVAVNQPMSIKALLRDDAGNPIQASEDHPLTFDVDPVDLTDGDDAEEAYKSGPLPSFPRAAFAANNVNQVNVENGGTVKWDKTLGPLTIKGILRKGETVFTFKIRYLDAAVFQVALKFPGASEEKKKSEFVVAAQQGTPASLQIHASPLRLRANGLDQAQLTVLLVDENQIPTYDPNKSYIIILSSSGGSLSPQKTEIVTYGGSALTNEKITLTASESAGSVIVEASASWGSGKTQVFFVLVQPTMLLLLFAALGGVIGGVLQTYKKLSGSKARLMLSELASPMLVINLLIGLVFYLSIYYGSYTLPVPFYKHLVFAALVGTFGGYIGTPVIDKVLEKLKLQKQGYA